MRHLSLLQKPRVDDDDEEHEYDEHDDHSMDTVTSKDLPSWLGLPQSFFK